LKITEIKRPTILSLILGILLTIVGSTIFLRPQGDTINMIFLIIFGLGFFMVGAGFSVLYQIKKVKDKEKNNF